VLLNDPGMTIKTCAKWQQDAPPGRLLKLAVGDQINGKGRQWVVMKGDAHSLEEVYEAASTLGDGVIAAKFEQGVFALIHREESAKDFPMVAPEGFQLVAFPVRGRLSKTARQSLIKLFLDSELIGSMMRDACVLSFREVVEKLPLGDPTKMLEIVANARLAKKKGKHDELKEAIVSMTSEIKQYAKLMKGNLSIKDVAQIARTYPESFPSWVDDLVGFYYDTGSKTLKEIDLKTVLTSEETWYMEYTIVFTGMSKSGKSTLGDAVGRYLAEAHSFSNVVVTKGSLGAFGLMTKANTMQTVGAFMFHDCKLEAYKDKPLSSEEKKGLWKVDEDASFLAPHGQATMLKYVPRIVTCNSGGTAEQPDYGWWFKEQGMKMAAKLARKDTAKLQNLSGEQEAQIRHFIIFHIDRKLYMLGQDVRSERKERFESRVK